MRGGHSHGHGMRSPLDDDDHPFVSKCVRPAAPAACKGGCRAVGAPADEPPALLLAQLQMCCMHCPEAQLALLPPN